MPGASAFGMPGDATKGMAEAAAAQNERERVVTGTQMCILCGRFRAVYGNFCAYCCATPPSTGGHPPAFHVGGFSTGTPPFFGDLDALRAATAAEEKRRADLEVRVAEKKKRVRTLAVYLPDEPLHYLTRHAASAPR